MIDKLIIKHDFELIEEKTNKEMCIELLKEFTSVQQGMTAFQIQNFVLCDMEFPTPDSKFWQAKLELFVRVQGIIQTHYDYKKKKAKIKELEALIEMDKIKYRRSKPEYKKKLYSALIEQKQIEIEENEFAITMMHKLISDKLKEMKAFKDSMDAAKKIMLHDPEDKETQERDYWESKSLYDPRLKERYPEVFNTDA